MSQFSYLQQNIRDEIRKEVKKNLLEVSIREPPVNYLYLYDNDKLKTTLFDKDHPQFIELAGKVGREKAEKIRGILFVDIKHVVIQDAKYARRNKFALLHEHGHFKLPWHNALLYKCTQFDLSAKARSQLEREANYYASELAFMADAFEDYLLSSKMSFGHIKGLSETFDMSIESTLRRSVELHIEPCALLSLSVNSDSETDFLKIEYPVYSQPFLTRYKARFNIDQTFPKKHVLSQIIIDPWHSMLNSFEGEVNFADERLRVEVWKNNWNIFGLFSPVA